MKHCKIMNYECVDLAKKIKPKYFYWTGGAHTTKEGSKMIADLIAQDLSKLLDDKK